MSFSSKLLITFLVCGGGVTLLRILPFLILKKFCLPRWMVEFLQFVPIVIMTTLWFGSLFTARQGHLPKVDWQYLTATLPTLLVAYFTKSLMWIVVTGVASVALFRFF
jgi:branched-subunit amino acid transport protein